MDTLRVEFSSLRGIRHFYCHGEWEKNPHIGIEKIVATHKWRPGEDLVFYGFDELSGIRMEISGTLKVRLNNRTEIEINGREIENIEPRKG